MQAGESAKKVAGSNLTEIDNFTTVSRNQMSGATEVRDMSVVILDPEDPNSERIHLEIELQKLLNEQTRLESRLQEVEQEIQHTETMIQTKMSPERARLLRQIRDSKNLAKMYAKKVLKEFIKLEEEIKSKSDGIEFFCSEIENWLQSIYLAIEVRNLAFLEPTRHELYLLDKDLYQNASPETYQTLFRIIKKDLCGQTSGEEREDLFECLAILEKQVLRFH